MFINLKKDYCLYGILFLSGIAGLGYEIVWMKMLSYGLGHEGPAMLASTAAFFIGLALGSWILDKPIKLSSKPQRIYVALEFIIGLWALILIVLIPKINNWTCSLIGVDVTPLRHWFVAFIIPGLLLLPATFSMGGTLPAMERFITIRRKGGRHLAGIYAANTFGAMTGTIIVTFVITPLLGYTFTLVLLAIINIICFGAMSIYRHETSTISENTTKIESNDTLRYYSMLMITGLLGIGYEILIIRILSQVLENTVYSFAAILAIYLLGSAIGASIYQRRWINSDANNLISNILIGLSTTCLIVIPVLLYVRPIYQWIHNLLPGLIGAVTSEMTVAVIVFAGPTIFMGALFSHLAQQVCNKTGGVGIAFSINTLGCSLAAPLFGIVLVPVIGIKASLILIAVGYLTLLPRSTWRKAKVYIPFTLAGMIALIPLTTHLTTINDGEKIITHREGLMGNVTVIKNTQGDFLLKVNDRFQMGGTASVFSDRSQGHIPLLLHPNPRRALFLGIGTGGTLAAAADYPGLETDGVELVPEVIDVMVMFSESTGDLIHNPQIHIYTADARRFVKQSKERYDVIIADLFHPARDGAGSLYTREHFDSVHKCLNPDGLFCQWLPLYQMNLETLRTITRTFLGSFPEVKAFVTHYNIDTPILGLVGYNQMTRYDKNWFEKRVSDDSLLLALKKLRLNDNYTLFGRFIAGREDLYKFAGMGQINTDDKPIVTYSTPSFVYNKQEPPYERLLTLLNTFSPKPDQILACNDNKISRRLAAYWNARDKFIRLGTTVNSSQSESEMINELVEPLLAIVQESPDFSAAYNPLLSMAVSVSNYDKKEAVKILQKLQKVNPKRKEPEELIRYISSKY